jgi:hypothetical protein
LGGRILFNPREIILQIGVRVREAVSEKLLVIIMAESVLKGQSVEISRVLISIFFEVIQVVVDILSNPVPADALLILDLV